MADRETFQIGMTQVAVGLSALVTVAAPRGVIGWQVKSLGGGSLALASGFSAANGYSTGYLLGASQILEVYGPATFFLASAGATTVVGLLAYYSAGYSLYP